MTIEQSDILVRQLFKWNTSPLDTVAQRELAISRTAAIVCDTGSGWLKTGPGGLNPQLAADVLQLHEAYARIKPEYVITPGGNRG